MPASKFRGLVPAMYPFSDEEWLCVCNTITTTFLLLRLLAVNELGKTWQLWNNAWCYFLLSLLFACCCLHYWRVVILTVEWIPACVCLVLACSSSWYVLYLFVRFSLGLLSTCVTTGWIFEISLCENSIQFNTTQYANIFGGSILLKLSTTQYSLPGRYCLY